MTYEVQIVTPRTRVFHRAVQVPLDPAELESFAAWAEENVRDFGRYEVDDGEIWLGVDEQDGLDIYARPGDWLVGFGNPNVYTVVWKDAQFQEAFRLAEWGEYP